MVKIYFKNWYLAHEDKMTGISAFKELEILIGSWSVKHDHGRISQVNYRVSCHHTVMVETWALQPNVESLTLYHMDGKRLVATHYCPLGNQPKLVLTSNKNGKYEFQTQTVSNLVNPDHDHCRAFSFHIVDKNTIKRTEIYAENGIETIERSVFTRMPL